MILARKLDAVAAIFTVLHTFGRDLKRNVDVHLSTIRVGLHTNLKKLKSYFLNNTP